MQHPDDPALGNSAQPANMSDYRHGEQDHGGVYVNNGIPNRAAYLIADGLSAEGLGVSIGRDKTEQIFYHALTTQLSPYAQFVDARRATISSAETLYPGEPAVAQAVTLAWNLVGVADNGDSPSSQPQRTPFKVMT